MNLRTPICMSRHKAQGNEAPKQENKRTRTPPAVSHGWHGDSTRSGLYIHRRNEGSRLQRSPIVFMPQQFIYSPNITETQNLVHKYMWKHISSIGMQTAGLVPELCKSGAQAP